MTVTRTRDRPTLIFFWSVNIDSALARLYVSYIAVVRLHSLKHGYFRYFRLELQLRRPWSRDRTVRETPRGLDLSHARGVPPRQCILPAADRSLDLILHAEV